LWFDLQGFFFAFTAGMFSLVSSCSYVLLPGYISYYFGTTVKKTVLGGFVCTIGLLTIFSSIAVLVSGFGVFLSQYIPFFDLIGSAIIMLMGICILLDIHLPYFSIPIKKLGHSGFIGLFIFGIAYGLVGISCSAPIFFSILFFAMTKGFINGIMTLLIYALGMGIPLILTSILVAEAKEFIIRRIVNVASRMHKISGVLLIILSISIIYFHYTSYTMS
jgi:cytochrome c-type biogenesis protein